MESGDKKKIIIIVVTMVALMIGMSIFMRTGMQDIKHDKIRTKEKQPASQEQSTQKEDKRAIKTISVSVNGERFYMDVGESAAAQEFAASTPFTLEMVDLNENEKYFKGEESLPMSPEQPKHINIGDVMLYGDKTIVIFYQSFDTNESYTRLGKIRQGDSLRYLMEGEKVTVDFYK